MDLYLCEKPSQAKSLGEVLRATQSGDGCLMGGNGVTITWAFGHMLEQYMPDDYNDSWKAWRMETLPIVPESWQYKLKNSCAKQFKVVKALLAKAACVYIATDYDREGESIARELMDRCGYKGTVRRVPLTSLDPDSIRKALNNTLDGSETVPLYMEAKGRQRADWLVGMNFSRAYTVLARQFGYDETLHIGRVITPTVSLVVERDLEIENFHSKPYWVIDATLSVQNGQFVARWLPPEDCVDEEGRCLNKVLAEQLVSRLPQSPMVIATAEKKHAQESAPLPFHLTSLQQYAAKRWGYTAQQTLEATQSLYETHKVVSYPRTSSRYLPESQRAEVGEIFEALIRSDPEVSGLVAGADASRNARVFNENKVEAHHAIIPTKMIADLSKLSDVEYNIYDTVRRFYIAQFYAPFEYEATRIVAESCGHQFSAKGKVALKQGWKVIFATAEEVNPKDDGEDSAQDVEQGQLPAVKQGEPGVVASAQTLDKQTKAPPHFTEATLLGAMEHVARFVKEEKFRKVLKETAGLGTDATRAGILEGAIDRGYIKRSNKMVLSTPKARALVKIVSDVIKSPGMTAGWEQELAKIGNGDLQLNRFMDKIESWVTAIVEQISAFVDSEAAANMSQILEDASGPSYDCFEPTCGGKLKRIKVKKPQKGKSPFFWACQDANCKKTCPDKNGKPVDVEKELAKAPKCPECNAPMRKIPGKKAEGEKYSFWGCTAFKDTGCKGSRPMKKNTRKKRTA